MKIFWQNMVKISEEKQLTRSVRLLHVKRWLFRSPVPGSDCVDGFFITKLPLTQHLLDHMGFLPLVAQEVGRDACENDAAADQTFERSRPEGHDDHEDAAQDETRRDEQRKLQNERRVGGGGGSGGGGGGDHYQKCQSLQNVTVPEIHPIFGSES